MMRLRQEIAPRNRAMRQSARHRGERQELEGIDPVLLFVIPLAILLLSLLVIRGIVAASVV